MRYKIADSINGAFSDVYETLEEAEKALNEFIEEGQKINDAIAEELEMEAEDASDFFCIVDAETGEEVE